MKETLFINKNSNTLIIAFSGLLESYDKNKFWFETILSSEKFNNISKLFIKDIENCWYLNGLKSENLNNINEISLYIINIINKYKFKNVFFLGSSMGAYAALILNRLVFNELKNINGSTLVFSPQTILTSNLTGYIQEKLKKLFSLNKSIPNEYLNLKLLYKNTFNIKNKIIGICSSENKYDMFHMKNLESFIDIQTYNSDGSHNIANWLRKNNLLEDIIINWLSIK